MDFSNFSMLMSPSAMYCWRSAFRKVWGSTINLLLPVTLYLVAVIVTSVRIVFLLLELDLLKAMDPLPPKHPYDAEIETAVENESLLLLMLLTVSIFDSESGVGTLLKSSSVRSKIDEPMLTKYGSEKSTL